MKYLLTFSLIFAICILSSQCKKDKDDDDDKDDHDDHKDEHDDNDSEDCKTDKVDISFVLDHSGSIGETNFKDIMLPTVGAIIDSFPTISDSTVRVSLTSFGDTGHLNFRFDEHQDKKSLLKSVKDVQYLTGNTATGDGLHVVLERLVPRVRPGVRHLIIVITDGAMNVGRPIRPESQALRRTGASILAVGTMDATRRELNEIAGSPSNVIYIESIYKMIKRISFITGKTCQTIESMPEQTGSSVQQKCQTGKADYTFVLDVSGSVGKTNLYEKLIPTMTSVWTTLNISPDQDRIAVVWYNDEAHLLFNLNSFSDVEDMMRQLDRIPAEGGGTATGSALLLVEKVVAPRTRKDVPHVVTVITDGFTVSGHPLKDASDDLKATGAIVYAIGVGHQVQMSELKEIASSPELVMTTSDYVGLYQRYNDVAHTICTSSSIRQPTVDSIDCLYPKNMTLDFILDNSNSLSPGEHQEKVIFPVMEIVNKIHPHIQHMKYSVSTFASHFKVVSDYETNSDFRVMWDVLAKISPNKQDSQRNVVLALNEIESQLKPKRPTASVNLKLVILTDSPKFSTASKTDENCPTLLRHKLEYNGGNSKLFVVNMAGEISKEAATDLDSIVSLIGLSQLKANFIYDEDTDVGTRTRNVLEAFCHL